MLARPGLERPFRPAREKHAQIHSARAFDRPAPAGAPPRRVGARPRPAPTAPGEALCM